MRPKAMAYSDSDEDDTFVTIGTALKTYDQDAAIKKPFQLQDQKVKDDQGRQRFHGAFTGGFSAGFYNTVGSKEGWTPSTFVSSRKERGGHDERRPEDFMDAEDLGEFGIAPRAVHTTDDFTSGQRRREKRPLVNDGIIPGEAPLADFIVPARLPVGVRLLRKLGWKEGQGIGPRVQRKRKPRKTAPQDTSKKVYGCSMPDNQEFESSEDDELDGTTLTDITFAPKDVCPISFVAKDNFHGLGYSGITQRPAAGRFELFDQSSAVGKKGRKGITGQAFGVGALEDDDGDIYGTSSMSQYDRVLGDTDHDNTHGWTAPTNKGAGHTKGHAESILEGFRLLSTRLNPVRTHAPPELPRDFRPHHVFSQEETNSSQQAASIPTKFSAGWKNMDASNRREALGDKPEFKSVFDLISPADRQALEQAKTAGSTVQPSLEGAKDVMSRSQDGAEQPTLSPATQPPTQDVLGYSSDRFRSGNNYTIGTSPAQVTSSTEAPPSGTEAPPSSTELPPAPARSNDPLFKGTVTFKPFAKDKAKQERYEQYLQETRYRKQVGGDIWRDCKLSRRDRDRERDEFARAARLYRPMAGMIASRFTRAKFEDDDNQVEVQEEKEDPTDKEKAAEMKMYGLLTRDIHEWHPSRILCKRFNVPDPYPDSGIVGLKKARRDKYSVFNFLSFPEGRKDRMPEPVDPEPATSSKRGKNTGRGKSLAIMDGKTAETATKDNQTTAADENSPGDDAELAPERPPLDLFKAIFEASDSEESSPEVEEETGTQEPPLLQQEVTSRSASKLEPSTIMPPNMFSRLFAHEDKGPKESHTPEGSPDDRSGSPERVSMSEYPVTATDDLLHSRLFPDKARSRGERDGHSTGTYGPELPPQLKPAVSTDVTLPDSGNSIRKHKKHKEKEKHKHKKKKSKHKKRNYEHKHKKKKKKKPKVVVTISSSDSSDTDSTDSPDIPSDTMILEKLRLVTGRTSAADYM